MNGFRRIKAKILLVEDNAADIRLTKEVLQKRKMVNSLDVVRDGVEAIDFLKKRGKFSNANTPNLILLDLNLPKRNGFEVLEEIKLDSSIKKIPVVILTTSEAEQDILKSYECYANCYITKPVDMVQFIKVVRSIGDFWFSIVMLPPGKNFDHK